MDVSQFINELNATTLKRIYPAKVRDFYFRSSALLARMRANGSILPWQGGLYEDNPFLYRSLKGGAYTKGQPFSTTKVETMSANRFDVRKYYVNVTEFLEDLYIVNRGPAAIVNRLGVDMRNLVNTMNEFIAIDQWWHGQGIAGGSTGNSVDRSANMNGLAEGINDGITPSWTGEYFPVYGGVDRTPTGTFNTGANPLRSTPYWVGNTDGSTSRLTYLQLQGGYQDCCIGPSEPDLGVCNRRVFAHILNTIQPQQRLETVTDYVWGVSGVKFRNATIVQDEYCPTAYADTKAYGSYTTSTFVVPVGAATASNLPTSGTTATVGGTFWWFTTPMIQGRMPEGLYGMQFLGFQRPFNADIIAGQQLLAFTLMVNDPRLHKQYYGITESY